MARRRLTPAQIGLPGPAPETKSALAAPDPTVPRAVPPIAQVSGQSAEAAALREITQGLQAARDEGRMVVELPLGDIAPGHLARDRVALDRAALDELKASIAAHGQRVPAEVTPLPEADASPYRYGLISGWRRLRALAELHEETGEARFATLRALMRPGGAAADSYVAMVEENEIRVGLSYYERARIVAEAAARGVFPDQPAALRALFATASRAKRSKIASFIDIHEQLGDSLRFPADIPERLGLALVSRLRLGHRNRIRSALAEARPASAAAELALLERLARAAPAPVSRAKHPGEVIGPGVVLRTSRKDGRMTITLDGDGVNDALLTRLRTALHGLQ